jgi:3-oxoacid CoA-transferase subunit A
VGELAPDDIHLPGIYVHRIVLNANPEKRIEKRTVTAAAPADAAAAKVEAQAAIAQAAAGSEVPAPVKNTKGA